MVLFGLGGVFAFACLVGVCVRVASPGGITESGEIVCPLFERIGGLLVRFLRGFLRPLLALFGGTQGLLGLSGSFTEVELPLPQALNAITRGLGTRGSPLRPLARLLGDLLGVTHVPNVPARHGRRT